MKVFLDVETTHLEPGQIAQLSYIVTDDQLNIVKAKNFYFAVETMSRAASARNGLNKRKLEKLSGDKVFKDHIYEIRADLDKHEIIGHNIEFDYDFLWEEFHRAGRWYRPKSRFCTMKCFTNLCRLPGGPKGQYKWPRLIEVMGYMGIKHREVANQAAEIFNCERPTAHDSRFDVMAVYMIYKKTFHRVEIEPTNQREAVAMLTATLNEVAAAKQAAERDHSKKPTQKPKKRRIGCLTILIIIWILSVIFLTE